MKRGDHIFANSLSQTIDELTAKASSELGSTREGTLLVETFKSCRKILVIQPRKKHKNGRARLLFRIGVFAACAATLITAGALIWLTPYDPKPFRHAAGVKASSGGGGAKKSDACDSRFQRLRRDTFWTDRVVYQGGPGPS